VRAFLLSSKDGGVGRQPPQDPMMPLLPGRPIGDSKAVKKSVLCVACLADKTRTPH
jgi:hypothetical protein